jgi:hypothetical protein
MPGLSCLGQRRLQVHGQDPAQHPQFRILHVLVADTVQHEVLLAMTDPALDPIPLPLTLLQPAVVPALFLAWPLQRVQSARVRQCRLWAELYLPPALSPHHRSHVWPVQVHDPLIDPMALLPVHLPLLLVQLLYDLELLHQPPRPQHPLLPSSILTFQFFPENQPRQCAASDSPNMGFVCRSWVYTWLWGDEKSANFLRPCARKPCTLSGFYQTKFIQKSASNQGLEDNFSFFTRPYDNGFSVG